MLFGNILETIGGTPVVQLKTYGSAHVKIYAKLEGYNPGGSVKDRTARYLLETAEREGRLGAGRVIIEATSGNTGIALAMISAVKGYRFIAVMPENASVERVKLLKAYGAGVILTEAAKGTNGSIEVARKMAQEDQNYFMPDQFANPANPRAHFETTGSEIIEDVPGITAFVAGVGTGGTLTGAGKRLKAYNPDIHIVGVEPSPGTRIQGLRNMVAYKPPIYDDSIIDCKLDVPDDEAFVLARSLYVREGITAGISSGAALWGAICYSKKVERGNIVVIFPDSGEKYFSTELFE
ncbi:MAG: cysteine synthase [Peptococcaceae bacterium BICA1-7]|nr:MAG: cysteine synthase [Peptococcaceae bacterium BICA1-7]HBV96714.1 cysteine synthase family protein [Desulfotomaculum sp.]